MEEDEEGEEREREERECAEEMKAGGWEFDVSSDAAVTEVSRTAEEGGEGGGIDVYESGAAEEA